MIKTLQHSAGFFILFFSFLLSTSIGEAQTTSLTMTVQNIVQSSASSMTYDVMLTNTGTTSIALRGYSCGINHAAGMNNGGTITHSYVSRDASLATLPVPTFAYTSSTNHLRLTTLNALAGNEVSLATGVPVRIATMQISNTVSFPTDFNPSFSMQLLAASGKTSCIATCIVTPPGTSYAINAPGNNPTAGTLQLLTGIVNTPCFYLNPSIPFVSNVSSTTNVVCYGGNTGSAQITLSGTGSASPLGTNGTYKLNGGPNTAYSSNPFTVSNLSAGTHTISVTTSGGCTSSTIVTITQPAAPISTTTNVSTLTSYTWAATGLTYSASGIYSFTTNASNGCDSTSILNLTIIQIGVTMTVQNAVQTAPNIFEYDVMLTYTGNTTFSLRGYSCGINHAAGMNNGGTISHTFLSRDASLSTLPTVTPGYTASSNHLRFTTVNATAGNEVLLTPGIPVRIARMRITNTANFPANFNPALNLQMLVASGKTLCIATGILNPPGSSYTINGPGNNPTAGTLQVLSGVINTPCFYLNPSALFTATTSNITAIPCYGGNNGSAQITLSGTGSAAPSGTVGTYKINGGSNIAYTGNPFTISNLSAGTKTVTVTTSFGCTSSVILTISQPVGPVTGSSSVTACNSYTWFGTTYTVSSNPTHTFVSASGCDSVHTLHITINQSNTGASSVVSCNAYNWNSNTYTNSGIYNGTFTNAAGCDSIHTLSLTINSSSFSVQNITAATSYLWAANNVTYTTSGVYTATILNAAGCDSIATLNLSILQINVLADQNVSCFGSNDGTILAAASGGLGSYTYDLDGANIFTNVTGYFFNVIPGLHTVCAKESSTNLIVCGTVNILEPTPIVASFILDSAIACNGSNGQLSIDISGGSPFAQPYLTLWTNGNGDTLNDQTNNYFALTVGNLSPGTYHVRIEDDNACVQNVDTIIQAGSCADTLQLKVFIEGYYIGSSTMNPVLLNQGVGTNSTITDSILVELHSSVAPYGIVDSKTAILNTDGTITTTFSGLNSSYYIVLKHRNALQTWSAIPIQFTNSLTFYDFSSANTQAYGNNMVQVDLGLWALYSGDLNDDENIDLLDLTTVETDINNFLFGYFPTDINGDGNVDLLDTPNVEANVNSFIFSAHP